MFPKNIPEETEKFHALATNTRDMGTWLRWECTLIVVVVVRCLPRDVSMWPRLCAFYQTSTIPFECLLYCMYTVYRHGRKPLRDDTRSAISENHRIASTTSYGTHIARTRFNRPSSMCRVLFPSSFLFIHR